jgi:cytochrome c
MFKRVIRCLQSVVLLIACATAAAQTPNRPEIVDLVNKTVAHAQKVGVAQAAADVNAQADWKVKGLNTVMFNLDGLNLASAINPRIVGKMMIEAKDPSGKQFVKEFIGIAKSPKGEGWVEFQFLSPESNQVEPRIMFVRRVPGQEALVGVAASKT